MGYREIALDYYGGAPSYPAWLATDTSLWLKGDNPLNTNIRWHDLSPNNHVLNGTATLTDNVLNGQKGYVFNGSTNWFNGGDILDRGLNSRTCIVISKINNTSSCIFSKSEGGNRFAVYCISLMYIDVSDGRAHWNTISADTTQFTKTTVKYDVANSLCTMNYKALSTAVVINSAYNEANNYAFVVGAYALSSYPLNGTICEIIFLERLLTATETTEINAYLNTKYAL